MGKTQRDYICSIHHLFNVLNNNMFQLVGVPPVIHRSGLALELALTAGLGGLCCWSATIAVTIWPRRTDARNAQASCFTALSYGCEAQASNGSGLYCSQSQGSCARAPLGLTDDRQTAATSSMTSSTTCHLRLETALSSTVFWSPERNLGNATA